MKIKDYLQLILEKGEENDNVNKVRQKFSLILAPREFRVMISALKGQPQVFEDKDCYKICSLQEVLESEKELGTNIKRARLIPLIECKDNVYICWNLDKYDWCKYNVVDESKFSVKHTILDFFN